MTLPPALQAILDEFPAKRAPHGQIVYVEYCAKRIHPAILRAWKAGVKASADIAAQRLTDFKMYHRAEELKQTILNLIPKGDTP